MKTIISGLVFNGNLLEPFFIDSARRTIITKMINDYLIATAIRLYPGGLPFTMDIICHLTELEVQENQEDKDGN